MTRRRLVFIHPSDEHYGADRILLDICSALPPEVRHDAEFWLPTDLPHGLHPLCERLEDLGGHVRHVDLPVLRRAYRTPRDLVTLARRARELTRLLREHAPEIVYLTTSAALLAAPAASRARVPHVLCHVQELWSPGDARVLAPLARGCDTLLAISTPVRDALPARLRERTTVILNGTNAPETLRPLTGRSGPLSYVVASRWNGWKGHRTLLAAWDRCDAPGALVVLGGPPASGESVDVPALVRDLREPASVDVVGEVTDIDSYLDAADVVVMPSDNPEPFGLVAIEAFARGRPVVASDDGGLADIVTHGHDGWLFPPGDVAALQAILGTLTRAEVEAAGLRARETYEARFTDRRFLEEWNRLVLADSMGCVR